LSLPSRLPRDLDILPILDQDFEVDAVAAPSQAIFDSLQVKMLYQSGIFRARTSIGQEVLDLGLATYQTSRNFRKRGVVERELP